MTWEGIIETDLWFGPLFTNFRLTKTDMPVHIRAEVPHRPGSAGSATGVSGRNPLGVRVSDVTDLSNDRLGAPGHRCFCPTLTPSIRQGEYAVMVRKRRACPFDPAALTIAKAD